jgi:hypothetical protein
MKPITLLTGPAASGKNTIGHIYATQFCQRCAVIDGDVVRAMLRQPHAAPWEAEGLVQHRLGVKHACLLARSFADEGYDVIILDIVWADLAQLYRQFLSGYPLRIIRLMPSWEETLKRLHERPHTITDDEARWVYQQQQSLTDFDHSIDNSLMSAEEVAAWLASLA